MPIGDRSSENQTIGYARRGLHGNIAGRGFDSRRLHCPALQSFAAHRVTQQLRGFFVGSLRGLRFAATSCASRRSRILRRFCFRFSGALSSDARRLVVAFSGGQPALKEWSQL